MSPESMTRKELIAEVKHLRLAPAHFGALIARHRKAYRKERFAEENKRPRTKEVEFEIADLAARGGALYELAVEFRHLNRRMAFKRRNAL